MSGSSDASVVGDSEQTQTLFGQTMTLVAATTGLSGLTMVDFQRLRSSDDSPTAPLLAASIFLDGLNVFLFFLNIFDRQD